MAEQEISAGIMRLADAAAAGELPSVLNPVEYREEFEILEEIVLSSALEGVKRRQYYYVKIEDQASFRQAVAAARGPVKLRRFLLASFQAFIWSCENMTLDPVNYDHVILWQLMRNLRVQASYHAIKNLLSRKLLLESMDLLNLLRLNVALAPKQINHSIGYFPGTVAAAERFAARELLTDEMKDLLRQIMDRVRGHVYTSKACQLAMGSAGDLIGEKPSWPIESGEAWADVALNDLKSMESTLQKAWYDLLTHAIACHESKPNRKWLEKTPELVEAIGEDELVGCLDCWLAKVGQPGSKAQPVGYFGDTNHTAISPGSQDVLCGLVWVAAQTRRLQALRAVADVAEMAFRTIARQGPRSPRLGNACVRALGMVGSMDALARLARLELRVRQPKGKKIIKKLLGETRERIGVSWEEMEETFVPDFGLRNGRAQISVGNWMAELSIANQPKPRLTWRKPDGKMVRGPDKALKAAQADSIAVVKSKARDVEAMLSAQRTRLDRLMRDNRTWRFDLWRHRYLEHGLIGVLAGRLIWTLDGTSAVFVDGMAQDVRGNPISCRDETAVVLWHPVDQPVEEIVAWRARLAELGITQPFKQAHREVYLLTDAERNTRVYSNRFAAHIVKSHVLVAIGQTRGWKVGLYGGNSSPSIELPQYELRAEFWADVAGSEYNDMGTPLHLATDQVRFCAMTHEAARRMNHYGALTDPVPIEFVPPKALSEVMRDIDLFVGVASVGNDPQWQDGGPDGRFRTYWYTYSFGDLSETARTRRQVLEGLIPRLKIAGQCTLNDKFLIVRGTIRTYKIHLGSGNILMEPNDQYLCIVPGRGQGGDAGGLFLPFEGDGTLSLILSKAFLLAKDETIADPTIVQQIRRQ